MSSPKRVIIIGAGVAALTLALCLKKADIESVIYERRAKDAEDEGNLALAPNALRILDYVGAYAEVAQAGFNYEQVHFLNGSLASLGAVFNGSQALYNFRAVRVRRQIVRQALLRRVAEQNIELNFNMRCVGVQEETEHSAVVTFQDGSDVHADFVVGADGIHSQVRRYLYPNSDPTFSGQMGIGGAIDRSLLHSSAKNVPMPCLIFGQQGSFALMPTSLDGNRVGFFATIEQTDRSREQWSALAKDKQALVKMIIERHCHGGWPEVVTDICHKSPAEELVNWPYFKVPSLQSYVSAKGSVAVIGDAAHAIPPTGGQGAAMALEDAATLAYTLSKLVAVSSRRSLLSKWEAHRMARIEKVLAFTTRGGDMRKSSVSPVQLAIKETLMKAYLWWLGPQGGLAWIYEYHAEDVLRVL